MKKLLLIAGIVMLFVLIGCSQNISLPKHTFEELRKSSYNQGYRRACIDQGLEINSDGLCDSIKNEKICASVSDEIVDCHYFNNGCKCNIRKIEISPNLCFKMADIFMLDISKNENVKGWLSNNDDIRCQFYDSYYSLISLKKGIIVGKSKNEPNSS